MKLFFDVDRSVVPWNNLQLHVSEGHEIVQTRSEAQMVITDSAETAKAYLEKNSEQAVVYAPLTQTQVDAGLRSLFRQYRNRFYLRPLIPMWHEPEGLVQMLNRIES